MKRAVWVFHTCHSFLVGGLEKKKIFSLGPAVAKGFAIDCTLCTYFTLFYGFD